MIVMAMLSDTHTHTYTIEGTSSKKVRSRLSVELEEVCSQISSNFFLNSTPKLNVQTNRAVRVRRKI